MANKSEKAAAAVEALFKKKPDATTDEFLEVAVAADPSLEGVGKRSFNASYLLPLKRAASKKAGSRKKSTAKKKTSSKKRTARSKRKSRSSRKAASGNGRVSDAARTRMRELILDRDRQVLETLGEDGSAKEAYALAARLDSYIDDLVSAMES